MTRLMLFPSETELEAIAARVAPLDAHLVEACDGDVSIVAIFPKWELAVLDLGGFHCWVRLPEADSYIEGARRLH